MELYYLEFPLRYENETGLVFEGCRAIGVDNAFTLKNCRGVKFVNCVFENCSNTIQIRENCKSITIENCSFIDCNGHNIQTDETPHLGIDVTDNHFIANGNPWIREDGNDQDSSGDLIAYRKVIGGIISNNLVSQGGEIGIGVYRGTSNVKVCNNLVTYCDATGIQVGSSVGLMVRDILVSNNRIIDCGLNNGGDASNQQGIRVFNADHVQVKHNYIARTSPIFAMDYGILATSVTDNLIVEGNEFSGLGINFRVPANMLGQVRISKTDEAPRAVK